MILGKKITVYCLDLTFISRMLCFQKWLKSNNNDNCLLSWWRRIDYTNFTHSHACSFLLIIIFLFIFAGVSIVVHTFLVRILAPALFCIATVNARKLFSWNNFSLGAFTESEWFSFFYFTRRRSFCCSLMSPSSLLSFFMACETIGHFEVRIIFVERERLFSPFISFVLWSVIRTYPLYCLNKKKYSSNSKSNGQQQQ